MSDANYMQQIRQLVELQKVDDQIFAVKQIKINAPADLQELEKKKNEVKNRRDKVLDKLEYLEDQRKRVFSEMTDHSEKMKKSEDKLMQIGTSREYQALMREKDSLEKTFRIHEDERSTLIEELQIQNEAKGDIDKEYAEICGIYDEKKATLDATLQAANEDLARLEARRKEVCEFIPRPKLMRYEFIRKRLEHPVIVEVEDGICSGCHIAIPPQTFIELQAGQQILSCPNCQRLIFWDQHFEMPGERRKPKEKQPEEVTEAEEAENEEENEDLEEE